MGAKDQGGCMTLLSREAFNEQVFKRDRMKCIFCTLPAVDAHHILDRKLFADGGYYLNNGASVCADHHLLCELTLLSVEHVRVSAGITEVIVPEGFDPAALYDKWGNKLRPDGLIEPGPLFEDTGCHRALVRGGALSRIYYGE